MAKIFKQLDQNKDGYLTPKEIMQGFKTIDCGFVSSYGKDPDWKEVIKSIDANGDGKIDFDEFLTAAANRTKLLNKENLQYAFRNLI